MNPWHRFALAVIGALLLSACDNDVAAPDVEATPAGEIRFRYSGDRAGTFQAQGALRRRLPGELVFGSYAAGFRDSTTLFVEGVQAGTRPKGDVLILAVAGFTGPGTYSIDLDRCATASSCSGMVFGLGVNMENDRLPPDRVYLTTSGSAVVTAVQDGRVRGTFSGVAALFNLETSSRGPELRISDGTFDVPLLNPAGTGLLTHAGTVHRLLLPPQP